MLTSGSWLGGCLALTVSGQPAAAATLLLLRVCLRWTTFNPPLIHHLCTSQVTNFCPPSWHLPSFSWSRLTKPFPQMRKHWRVWAKQSTDDLIRILFWPLKILWFFILRIEKKLLWKLFLSNSHTETFIYYLLIFVDVVSCNTEHTNKHVIPDEDYPGSYSLEMPEHSKNYKKQSPNVPRFSHGGFSFGLCCYDKLHDQINLGGKEFTLLTSYRPSQKKPKAGAETVEFGPLLLTWLSLLCNTVQAGLPWNTLLRGGLGLPLSIKCRTHPQTSFSAQVLSSQVYQVEPE